MRLSPHFTLAELTTTSHPFPNTPTAEELERLCLVALHLEVIRAEWGPLRVTSGYRSEAVNAAAGGVPDSAHRYGCAADFVPVRAGVTPGGVWLWLPESGLLYDQAIHEYRAGAEWVHLGLARPGRGRARRQHFTQDLRNTRA